MGSDQLQFDVNTSQIECEAFKEPWNDLVGELGGGIDGPDVTTTFEWTQALRDAFALGDVSRVVVATRNGKLEGVLPLYTAAKRVHRLTCRVLAPIQEIYGGRSGLVQRSFDLVHDTRNLLRFLRAEVRDWDALSMTVVAGSPSQNALRQAAIREGLGLIEMETSVSPYVVLDKGWDALFNSRAKKFRWHLRKSVKRLEQLGNLVYHEAHTEADTERFLQVMLEIERQSWKEAAGTSITANAYQEEFYRRYLPAAAVNGLLSGHWLEIDGEPVAYVCGVLHLGIFYDLKESYRHDLRSYSPSHALKMYVFPRLIERGARVFDFCGFCEEFKLRWTSDVYERVRYLVVAPTIRGQTIRLLESAIRLWRRRGTRATADVG